MNPKYVAAFVNYEPLVLIWDESTHAYYKTLTATTLADAHRVATLLNGERAR